MLAPSWCCLVSVSMQEVLVCKLTAMAGTSWTAHARAHLQHAILHTLPLSPLRRLAKLQASHVCKVVLSQGLLRQRFKACFICRLDLSLAFLLSQVVPLHWKVHHVAMLLQPRLGPPRAQVSHGSRPQAQGCCCPPSCQLMPGPSCGIHLVACQSLLQPRCP